MSEKLVKDDYFTSIHIEEFEIQARDTKLGPRRSRATSRTSARRLLHDLDESGVIRIGANVKPGDILVGKVTPKGETQLTPEERLLRAIFGEKAGDVRDASLRLPAGHRGHRRRRQGLLAQGHREGRARQVDRGGRARDDGEEPPGRDSHPARRASKKRLAHMLRGQTLRTDLVRRARPRAAAEEGHGRSPTSSLDDAALRSGHPDARRRATIRASTSDLRQVEERTERQVDDASARSSRRRWTSVRRGDELPPGVIKLVKVYIAMKRKLSVGDKMAGRHGNKGVVAAILPEEDMPYLPDGTPVEIVLNPLGVPSRMNIGQILETHLGWAAHALGVYFATPVFDGATEDEIKARLDKAGLPDVGQDAALRRAHRRAVRAGSDGGLHLHAEAVPPGRRQDPRPLDRAVLARSPSSRWAARRSSAASASARWRCGRSRPTARRTRCRSC